MSGPSTTSPGATGTGWPPDEPTPGRSVGPRTPGKRRSRGAAAKRDRAAKRERPARAPKGVTPARSKRRTAPPRRKRRTAAAEAERAARRRSRRKVMIATFSVGLVLLAGAIGYGIWRAQTTSPYPVPAHLTRNGEGLVAGGSGPVTVDLYADFACATCQSFVLGAEGVLGRMIAANQITLVYHPLSQHDSAGNTRYSTRAATSLACASDLSHLLAYANALWAAEAAGTSGLSDDRLVQVAGSVGIIDPRFARCLREQTYDAWVGKATDAAVTGGYTGAPTILVNGASIAPRGAAPTAAELIAAVAAAPGK